MKFICLLPVRDEADIIGQCLSGLLTWADSIYVFDTGSVDHTWDIVNDMARRDRRVIPLHREPVFFSETRLRGWMFHKARSVMRDGDWFLRVDADEFHHVPPPKFVREVLKPHETIVYHQYYDFRLTESEVLSWEQGGESIEDRKRPIELRRRWFTPSVYSEPRLCRYRSTMQWPPTVSFPYNAGFVARARLPIRHYPHRDPVQLERRCRLRAVMMEDAENRANWSQPELHHWIESEWRKFVVPDDLPGMQRWDEGVALPEIQHLNHLAPAPRRLLQRMVHGALLPVLDRLRPEYPPDAFPQRIPEGTVQRLERELAV